jgi:hypothetical protein
MVANVTVMNTRDALLRLMSNAVPRAVGTTADRNKKDKERSMNIGMQQFIPNREEMRRPISKKMLTSHEVILPAHVDRSVDPLGLEEQDDLG